MSTIPGLFVIGEANFSDHGANRLGASALMQGLADGYFVLPYTLANFIAGVSADGLDTSHEAFAAAERAVHDKVARLLSVNGDRTVDSFHRELGRIMWDYCGMERSAESLTQGVGVDSAAARGVLAQRACAGQRGGPEPESGDGGTGGGFHGAGRAVVHRRARPQ